MIHKNNLIAPKTIDSTRKIHSESIIKPIVDDDNKDKQLVIADRNKLIAKPITPIRLRTNTITNCRKSVGKVTRMAAAGRLDIDRAGKLCYLLQCLVSAFKAEAELSVVDEIKRLKLDIARITETAKNSDFDDES